jgi:hypothetical protein
LIELWHGIRNREGEEVGFRINESRFFIFVYQSQIRADFYHGNRLNGHSHAQVWANEEISMERDLIFCATISDLNIFSLVRSHDTFLSFTTPSHIER